MAMFLSGLFRLKWSGAEVINEKKGRYTGGVLEHSRRKYQVSAAIGLFRFR